MMYDYDDFHSFYIENAPINLLEKGNERCERNYHVNREYQLTYDIEYIENGRTDFCINSKNIKANAGDIIVIPKMSSHSCSAVNNEPCQKWWAVFDGPVVNALISSYLPKGKYQFKCEKAREIFEKIMMLKADSRQEYGDILKQFTLLIHELLIEIRISEEKNSKENASQAQKIKNYIDENIFSNLTVQNIADEFNYSKNHTIVIFKDSFGLTPIKYMINKKMDFACLYLSNTSFSVGKISEKLGFADQHYFSNVFLKVKGMTPTGYRKSMNIYFSDSEENKE